MLEVRKVCSHRYLIQGGVVVDCNLEQDDIILPNGMTWDLKRKVMYFADTGTSAIYA